MSRIAAARNSAREILALLKTVPDWAEAEYRRVHAGPWIGLVEALGHGEAWVTSISQEASQQVAYLLAEARLVPANVERAVSVVQGDTYEVTNTHNGERHTVTVLSVPENRAHGFKVSGYRHEYMGFYHAYGRTFRKISSESCEGK